ncbi:isochorismatase [Xylariales sp. AK1849]|nr:isochorismatase [Xylariales sp. AK1849]
MAPDLTFGPEGNQWHYERSAKTYDLTRGGSKKVTISTTKGPTDTRITIDPEKTALVVVDMQNFFLDANCRSHPTGLAAVAPTLTVINKCRKIGVQVVWLNWGLRSRDLATMPASVQRGFARSLIAEGQDPIRNGLGADLGDGKGRTLVAGEWNSLIWPPLAAAMSPDDVQCPKNRMSGLWSEEQPLWKYLESSGKKTLLFTGVNTDQCVLGTLSDAYNAGWDCVMIEDGCATTTKDGHDVCVHNVSSSYGFVTNSKSFASGTLA